MDNRALRLSVSAIVILTMVISTLGVMTIWGTDRVLAATDAATSGNTVTVPKNMKYGKAYTFKLNGCRYDTMHQKYLSFAAANANVDTSVDTPSYDVSMFEDGETYYTPVELKIYRNSCLAKSMSFAHFRHEIKSSDIANICTTSLPAGKYTYKAEYVKCAVKINTHEYYEQDVAFIRDLSQTNIQSGTFYVAAKIKFSNNTKKGKLAKSKTTKYLNPTTKFGKLPKPKAKRGQKFVGWYTKKSGGTKITKNSKVPQKNTLTLYARYKRVS